MVIFCNEWQSTAMKSTPQANARAQGECIGVRCARKTVQPSIHCMSDWCARAYTACGRRYVHICRQSVDLFHLIVHSVIPTHLTFPCWWTECQIWHSVRQSLKSCHTAEVKVSARRLWFASEIRHSLPWRSYVLAEDQQCALLTTAWVQLKCDGNEVESYSF